MVPFRTAGVAGPAADLAAILRDPKRVMAELASKVLSDNIVVVVDLTDEYRVRWVGGVDWGGWGWGFIILAHHGATRSAVQCQSKQETGCAAGSVGG